VAFDAPSRGDMGAVVLRALRDPTGSVFPATTVADFITQAMADLSAYRPKEAREISAWPLVPDPFPPFTDFTSVWKVELRVLNEQNGYVKTVGIPYGDSNSVENRAGWDFYDSTLWIPPFWNYRLDAATVNRLAELWVWGYQDRVLPEDDGEILDLTDTTDYVCVLNHCKAMGFELLTHDRALYQQWLAATNNTDVSPTQLSGMVNQAESTFQRSRARNTKMRRVPSGDYAHAH
jgi:hypothetical protein